MPGASAATRPAASSRHRPATSSLLERDNWRVLMGGGLFRGRTPGVELHAQVVVAIERERGMSVEIAGPLEHDLERARRRFALLVPGRGAEANAVGAAQHLR